MDMNPEFMEIESEPEPVLIDLTYETDPESSIEPVPTSTMEIQIQPIGMKECSICQDQVSEAMDVANAQFTLACGHVFHENCLHAWIIDRNHKSCPMCRTFTKRSHVSKLRTIGKMKDKLLNQRRK